MGAAPNEPRETTVPPRKQKRDLGARKVVGGGDGNGGGEDTSAAAQRLRLGL